MRKYILFLAHISKDKRDEWDRALQQNYISTTQTDLWKTGVELRTWETHSRICGKGTFKNNIQQQCIVLLIQFYPQE